VCVSLHRSASTLTTTPGRQLEAVANFLPYNLNHRPKSGTNNKIRKKNNNKSKTDPNPTTDRKKRQN